MKVFGETLIKLRSELGHKSAKSAHDYFHGRGLDCNYQYYVKIEKSLVLPSNQLVNQLAKLLKNKKQAETLIQAFCSDQFKSFAYLFKPSDATTQIKYPTASSEPQFPQGQKTLSTKQIHTLAKRKETYYLFLLITLSRRPLRLPEIENLKGLKSAVSQLQEDGILILAKDEITATSTEFVFPKADSDDLKLCFEKFDSWDKEFEKEFTLENIINKMMIRRISVRYLNLILQQIDVLASTLRVSDESDSHHNNQVVQLQIRLSKGELPG